MTDDQTEEKKPWERAQDLLESADWAQARFDDNGDMCVAGAVFAMFNPAPVRKGWHISRARLIGDMATFSLTIYMPRKSAHKEISVRFGKREFSLIKGWGFLATD